jgi:DNA-directed RNA polymerase specialized sigma24 family protein
VQRERNDILKRQIDRLPKVMRQALEPYCVGNFKVPELADALGISKSAAKSRILRARNTLLRNMKSPADANEMPTGRGCSSLKGEANVHDSSSPDN